MVKRTIYFGSPAYLSTRDEQLVVNTESRGGGAKPVPLAVGEKPVRFWIEDESTKLDATDEAIAPYRPNTVPIEDIGLLVLDHQQITISQGALAKLIANNVGVVTCNETHHPTGMFFPLDGSTVQGERFRAQIDSSEPLKKQMWAQTITSKVLNQASVLERRGIQVTNMRKWASEVTSGDPKNIEARAAVYYWDSIFTEWHPKFIRDRDGLPPNNVLNYGYAILRAIVARGLVSSGLLPTLGIHHRNKYNAYCLADDIMEPYRPFVDELVCRMMENGEDVEELTPSLKKQLLSIPVIDVAIGDVMRPLMVAVTHTTASVAKCFLGERRKILYPSFPYV